MISVVQILKKEGLNYQKTIENNSVFLSRLGVEYIVYDNLEDTSVLEFIKNYPSIKYFRKTFKSTKSGMLETGLLSTGQKILYIKSGDEITNSNIEELEKVRPNILRADLKKISKIEKENFSYDDFYFLIKEEKNFIEKFKLMFMKG